jgi:hypothetical protein
VGKEKFLSEARFPESSLSGALDDETLPARASSAIRRTMPPLRGRLRLAMNEATTNQQVEAKIASNILD